MIEKIISCGRNCIERTALTTARSLNVAYGGWAAWGANIDPALRRFHLTELPQGNAAAALAANVRDSDGTLFIVNAADEAFMHRARNMTRNHDRSSMHIDPGGVSAFNAARDLAAWIKLKSVEVLHVTGSDDISGPPAAEAVRGILETAYHMGFFDMDRYAVPEAAWDAPPKVENLIDIPKSIDQAADALLARLTFRERTRIANIPREKLIAETLSLQVFVRQEFRLWLENKALMATWKASDARNDVKDAAAAVIVAVWEKLQRSMNVLKIVK